MTETAPLFVPGRAAAAVQFTPITLISDQAYPEVMREIADVVARSLVEGGLQHERALALGEAAAEAVRERHGGTLMYLPKGHTMKTRRRWQALWDEFTGDNHAALAVKHGMNVKGVYKVLAVMRAEHRKRTQADLFDADQSESRESSPESVAPTVSGRTVGAK